MNVHMTKHHEEYIRRKIASGRYSSASEVVREGLRLLEEKDRLQELHVEEVRDKIRRGRADVQQGRIRPLDMEAIKAEARARWEAEQQHDAE